MRLDGPTAFLISKPLQLMVALLIVRDLELAAKPVFVITKSFSGAQQVSERLEKAFDQVEARFFETQAQAYAYMGQQRFAHVFIDSDTGFRKYMTLARLKYSRRIGHFHVFEEGLGTYRTDLYHGLKARVFETVGIATRFGANAMTERVFVLEPEEYARKLPDLAGKATAISGTIRDMLSEDHDRFMFLFDVPEIPMPEGGRQETCSLYLTSWAVDEGFLAHLRGLPGDVFIKAHPHIQGFASIDGLLTIDPGAPAELVLVALLREYDHVEVFDHFSSVRRYVQDRRIKYRKVSSCHTEFRLLRAAESGVRAREID